MGKPNAASWRVAAAIHQRDGDPKVVSGSLSAYREDLGDGIIRWVVYNMGTPVMRLRISSYDPFKRSISLSLGGWPDSSTARNNINSMLMRLGSLFRVGMHKGTPYLYEVKGEAVTPVMRLDATSWYSMEDI